MNGGSEKKAPQGTVDLDVEALVDGQLSPEREQQVWRDISLNPLLFAQYDRLVTQKRQLLSWWKQETEDNRKSMALGLPDGDDGFGELLLLADQKSSSKH